MKDHGKDIERVMKRLKNAQLYAKKKECKFFMNRFKFLGYTYLNCNSRSRTQDPMLYHTIPWHKSFLTNFYFLVLQKFDKTHGK